MILKIRKNYFIFGLIFLAAFFVFGAKIKFVSAQNLGHGAATSIFTKPADGTLFSYDWNNLLAPFFLLLVLSLSEVLCQHFCQQR